MEEKVWRRFEEWRDEMYRKAERREIYWDECEKVISEELWRVSGMVRRQKRVELCGEVETILQKLFDAVEHIEKLCKEINNDKLLSLTGRWIKCAETRMMLDATIGHAILWLATLANGVPECEEKALKWKERWEGRGGKLKKFPL